jgi:two-component system, LytTR family, sensor kinase
MNPILKNRNYLFVYLLAWVVISSIQASILVLYFNMDLDIAVVDSIVFNSLFFAFGLVIWYPVRYIPLSKRNTYHILLNHVALGILVITTWISSGFFILKSLFNNDEDVIQSILVSMPYRTISGVLLFILLLLVYYLIVYSKNLKDKIRNEANLQTLVREAELNMLKSQINPHFLFNSLNSISSLTMRDPSLAREMIIRLSEYLRYSLRHSEIERISLRDEVENIRRYLGIEKIRFGKRLIFSINMDAETENWLVPAMILQPLFENAVKHGVYESTEPIHIEMRSEIDNHLLVIHISNNFDRESPGRAGAGIGLKNIKDRLRLIYDREDLLSCSKSDDLFIVKLHMPR